MSVFVVDTSLVIKWFVPEVHSEAARQWLDAPHDYVAPDLLFAELGNVVWKKVRRKELAPEAGRRLVTDVGRAGIETVVTRSLLADALTLALAADITVYDAMYLTLAVRLDTAVITADERLAGRVTQISMLARHVRRAQEFS